MADRNAIDDLFARYAWGMDSRQFDFTKDTFAADARFTLDIQGNAAIEPMESTAIGEFIETTTREQTDQRRHVITNLHVEDEREDSARAIAYLTLMVTENDELHAQATGVYTTEVGLRDGDWRFTKMHLDLDRPF
ncbi:MAG: nuclear transport factor 2 family protein [Solirubrobacteraceae bacterium]